MQSEWVSEAAQRMGIDPALAAAVLAVESGGRAFGPDGRLLIRFEVHIFWQEWGKHNPEKFDRHFQFAPAAPWRGDNHVWRARPGCFWEGVHKHQGHEWTAFGLAGLLCDARAAKMAISMGAPQIMGFNYARIGYQSVDAMFDAFATDERAHVAGMFDFIKGDPRLVDALRFGDLRAFAAIYNGPAQADAYAARLRAALSGR